MDIFDDFTMYSYAHFENAVNIGWNNNRTPHGGLVKDGLKEALVRYLDYRVNMTRGSGVLERFSFADKSYTLGCAEIRLIAGDGTVYAAPDSIVSLVVNADYSPPEKLVDADINGVDPNSDQYTAFIENYNLEHFWGAPKEYIQMGEEALSRVLSGDTVALSKYLSLNPDALTIVTNDGSILNAAIKHGLEKPAMLLLDYRIPIDRYNGGELFTAIDTKMDSVAIRLIDEGIPLHNYSPQSNPLFYAISKHSNTIAKKLAKTQKHLACVYNTPFVHNCNLLQWCIRCQNKEMLDYITEVNSY